MKIEEQRLKTFLCTKLCQELTEKLLACRFLHSKPS